MKKFTIVLALAAFSLTASAGVFRHVVKPVARASAKGSKAVAKASFKVVKAVVY